MIIKGEAAVKFSMNKVVPASNKQETTLCYLMPPAPM